MDPDATRGPGLPGHPGPPTHSGGQAGWIGPYRIEGELARGGMGVVYRAVHSGLGRRVAIKLQLPGVMGTETERFRIEAQAAARLRHPNIVGIHEVGTLPDGRSFLVMDLIEGRSLKGVLDENGPLDPNDAARISAALARALGHAHQHSVLHRDLKPANVLLASDGQPVLTDFGLAKQVDAEGQGLTVSGQVMGTPAYMPPEQADGRVDQIDRRADVYGLGATLYALLTGQAPFSGESVLNILTKVLTKPPESPRRLRPDLDRDLETICLRCLEKEPDQRYPGVLALAEDLERYLAGEPIAARPVGLGERLWRRARRRPQLVVGGALVALGVIAALAAALGWAVTKEREARAERETARAAEANAKSKEQDAQEARAEAEASQQKAERAERIADAQALLEQGYGLLQTRRARHAARTFAQACASLQGLAGEDVERLRRAAQRGAAEGLAAAGSSTVFERPIDRCAFAPRGGWVAFSEPGKVSLARLRRSGRRLTLQVESSFDLPRGRIVSDLGFGPRGRLVYATRERHYRPGSEAVLVVRDVPGGDVRQSWTLRVGAIHALTFAADGAVLSAADDGAARLFRVGERTPAFTLAARDRPQALPGVAAPAAYTCAIADRRALVGYADGTVSLWDLQAKRQVAWANMGVDVPTLVSFAPDERKRLPEVFVAGGVRGWVGRLVRRRGAVNPQRPNLQPIYLGVLHTGEVGRIVCGSQTTGRDGSVFALASAEGAITISMASGERLAWLRAPGDRLLDVALSPDRSLLAGATGSSLVVWDLSLDQVLLGWPPLSLGSGRSLAWVRRRVYQPKAGERAGNAVAILDLEHPTEPAQSFFVGMEQAIRDLALSPDDQRVAIATVPDGNRGQDRRAGQGAVIVSELRSNARPRRFRVSQPRRVAWDGTSRVLVGAQVWRNASALGGVTALNLSDGRRQDFGWHVSSVNALVPLRAGSFATASDDGTCARWGSSPSPAFVVRAGALAVRPGRAPAAVAAARLHWLSTLGRPADGEGPWKDLRLVDAHGVQTITFSADAGLLASGGADGVVRLWSASDGVAQGQLEGHRARLALVGFTRDGRLVSVDHDRTIRVWDLSLRGGRGQPGRVVRTITVRSAIEAAALAGDRLAAAFTGGTVRVWDLRVPVIDGFQSDPVGAVNRRLR